MCVLRIAAALAAGLLCSGFTMQSADLPTHYRDYGGTMPKRGYVWVCHGSGCEWKAPFRFTRQDYERLHLSFVDVRSAREERIAIARAVAWIERRVCKSAGTCGDKAGAGWLTSKIRGQLDCVDEAMNTTSYLLTLERWGLLRFHKVITPLHRYSFTMFPHWTARIKGKREWAVDSYFERNGAMPRIVLSGVWAAGG